MSASQFFGICAGTALGYLGAKMPTWLTVVIACLSFWIFVFSPIFCFLFGINPTSDAGNIIHAFLLGAGPTFAGASLLWKFGKAQSAKSARDRMPTENAAFLAKTRSLLD